MGAYEYEYLNEWGNPNANYKVAQNDSVFLEASKDNIVIYPNPVTEQFTIRLNSEVEEKVIIQMINTIGEIEWEGQIELVEGMNHYTVNRNGLAKGIYFIKLNYIYKKFKTFKLIFN